MIGRSTINKLRYAVDTNLKTKKKDDSFEAGWNSREEKQKSSVNRTVSTSYDRGLDGIVISMSIL